MVSIMQETVKILGIDQHKPQRGTFDARRVADSVRAGLRFEAVEAVKEALQINDAQLARLLGVGIATLQRKRKKKEALSAGESDRLFRVARVVAHAIEVFGGREQARSWLTRPQYGLDREIPVDLLDTGIGAREVEALIGRIDHGVLA